LVESASIQSISLRTRSQLSIASMRHNPWLVKGDLYLVQNYVNRLGTVKEKSKMIETKATKPSDILENTSAGGPDLHISPCGTKRHGDSIRYSRGSSDYPIIELRSGSLEMSTEQPPEVLEEISIHRRREDGRGACTNEASLTIFYEDPLFHRREPSELSMAKGSSCSAKCTARAKTRDAWISTDDKSCYCMYKSSEDVENTKCRTLCIKTDNFRPVIHPLDSNLLMPTPSPLELDHVPWTSPIRKVSAFCRGEEH
jgi:hypothetical protein